MQCNLARLVGKELSRAGCWRWLNSEFRLRSTVRRRRQMLTQGQRMVSVGDKMHSRSIFGFTTICNVYSITS